MINRLLVAHVPKGAKLVAKCRGCGTETITAKRTGTIRLRKILGHTLRAGTTVELKVTLGRTGRGKYRYGATGKRFRWPVHAERSRVSGGTLPERDLRESPELP